MSPPITILGTGAMATVCSLLLTQTGHDVTMWSHREDSIHRLRQNREQSRLLPGVSVPPNVHLTPDDAEAFSTPTLIVSAIPTQYIRGVWQRLKPHYRPGTPIVSVAKGIENRSLLRPTQIIADVLTPKPASEPKGEDSDPHSIRHSALDTRHSPTQHSPLPLAALSGPNIAPELARYLPATAVAASPDEQLATLVQHSFSTPWFRVYTNPDLTGVELAGATKNVIAIAAGILDGLAAGNNAKAALVTRGLVEISRLGIAMGARESTFQGLAGIGDLITTCVSPEGRNRTVGERIGKGHTLPQILASTDSVAEGIPTTQSVHQLAQKHNVEMPITAAVHAVLFEHMDAIEALTTLMSRDPKPERP